MTQGAAPAPTVTHASSAGALALQARGLSKRYRRGEVPSLNALLLQRARDAWRRRRGEAIEPDPNVFWALEDVDFDIARGEMLGLLGHNGAGKTTLLKIISRITAPTAGWVKYRGRVASLLGVGAGFHRELTGRQNVYLNGAFLGMSRREVGRLFDAIVDFAGIADFIDTPVKFYSSGIHVRLAFAVAVHLRADIVLMDEVLTVGDAAFRAKCERKMAEVTRDGRTILFTSHNLGSIRSLCHRAILLERGRIVCEGPPAEVIETYGRRPPVR